MFRHHSTEQYPIEAVAAAPQYEQPEVIEVFRQELTLPHFEPGALRPLIISRTDHRNFLYGEQPDHPDTIESLASLTLCTQPRYTAKVQGFVGKFKQLELTEAVDAILAKHDDLSQEGDTIGCFSLTDTERDLPPLSFIAAAIIWRWERVCQYHNLPSPFRELPVFDIQRGDFYRADVQLVIETASVVLEALQNRYRVNRKNVTSPHNLETANFLARRGPQFATAWARGEAIISDYCAEHDLKTDEWLKILNPGRMRTMAVANVEPLQMLKTKVEQYRAEMTSEALASQLGWSIEKVDDVFPPSVRQGIWATRTHPKKTFARIVYQLETACNTAVIAESVSWDAKQVDEIFSVADRVRVFKSCNDPISKFRDMARAFNRLTPEYIAELISWPVDDVKAVFLPNQIKKRIGLQDPDDFIIAMAERYKTILSDKMLAQKLNLTLPQVNALFPPNKKIRLAGLTTDTLIRKLPNIPRLNVELSRMYELPPAITSALAHQSRLQAHKTAQAIITDLKNKPSDISEAIWMWQSVNWPSATRQTRIKSAHAWIKLLQISMPTSLDTGLNGNSFHDVIEDKADAQSAEDIFMTVQPDDYLQLLARKAKVSMDQLLDLLRHLQEGDIESLGTLQPVLDRLALVAHAG